MVPTVPLFPGIPGGIELLIVLMFLILFGGGAILFVGLLTRGSSNDAEIERLERRVDELERQNRAASGENRSDWDDRN